MKNNNAYMAIGDGLTFLYAIPEDAYEQCFTEIKRECEQYMQQHRETATTTLFMSARLFDYEVNRCNTFAYQLMSSLRENKSAKDILNDIIIKCLNNKHDELPKKIWLILQNHKQLSDENDETVRCDY